MPEINFPSQCSCGHIILEKYVFSDEVAEETGIAGFSWCGFCRTRVNIPHVAKQPRFDEIWCSQCGEGFGAGNNGYSHCEDHANETPH